MATSTVTDVRKESVLAHLRRVPLSRFEWACVAFALVGLSARLAALTVRGVNWDTGWYLTMAVTLLEEGEFTVPWKGEGWYTQHFPPLYPALLALAFKVFGPSLGVMLGVGVAISVLFIVVAFLTTWDLFGRDKAFAVAGVAAVFPVLVTYDVQAFTETLVCLFFTLTIWAILRSLERPPFVVLAGLFAGLGYLTKASMGAFFILAGAGGFAWRFYFMRWRLFRDPYYLSAAALFGSIVAFWAGRNVLRHGWPNWETQKHASVAFDYMFSQPEWPLVLLQQFMWSSVVLFSFAVPFWPWIRASARRWREEATSGLILGIITPTFIAVFFVTAFHMLEHHEGIVTNLNRRYLVTPIVPLLWLALRDVDLSGARRAEVPAGEPENGRGRARLSTGLAVGGVALAALAFALDPTAELLSLERVLVQQGLVVAGVALVVASRLLMVRPAVRAVGTGRGRETTWRLVPDERGGRLALTLIGVTVVALGLAWLLAMTLFPFFIAAAFAFALTDNRAKVAAVAAVFLGAALAGAVSLGDEQQIARDIAEAAASGEAGATVGVLRLDEQFMFPFLPDSLVLVPMEAGPEWVVHLDPTVPYPTPPDGYELWREYPTQVARLPGTLAERALEDLLTGSPPQLKDRAAAYVYVRAGGDA